MHTYTRTSHVLLVHWHWCPLPPSQELELARLKKRLASVSRDPSFRRIGELNAVLVSAAARGNTGRRHSDLSVNALVRMGMWVQEGARGAASAASGLAGPGAGAGMVSPLLPPLTRLGEVGTPV